jgi:hypothetical protein
LFANRLPPVSQERILPGGRVTSLAAIEKSVAEKMVAPFPGIFLFVGSLTVLATRLELFFQFVVKVVQFIDHVCPADLGIVFFAQPGEPFFEQVQHPLDKCQLWAIFLGHEITSISSEMDWKQLNRRG